MTVRKDRGEWWGGGTTPLRRTVFDSDTHVQPATHSCSLNQHVHYANDLHNSFGTLFCCLSARAKAQRLIAEYVQRSTKKLAGYRYTARYPLLCTGAWHTRLALMPHSARLRHVMQRHSLTAPVFFSNPFRNWILPTTSPPPP